MKCVSCSASPASFGGWPSMAFPNRPASPRMPMNEITWAVLAWCLAVVLLGWTWLPALLSGLGWTRYSNGGSEDPTQLSTATEPDFLFWQQQLVGLGYEPLGMAWMRITFNGPDWRYQTEVRVFRSNRT